ncbi:MAG: hypothetical protein IT510_04135 [Sulfuritalea sp.]|jgi:hypothetical protein|nr:hypothetical protein [Azonexus sp.]MCC7310417.1 hypothetical protein [Sulfuritalea sp.]
MGFLSRFTGKSDERPSAGSGPSAADPAVTLSGLGDGTPAPAERDVCIPILNLVPGMRLAQSVRRADGAVLLPAGSELGADQLRRLIQRGIECVHVLQRESRDAVRIEHDVAAAAARVAHLFRGDGSAARRNLGAAIAAYRQRAAS